MDVQAFVVHLFSTPLSCSILGAVPDRRDLVVYRDQFACGRTKGSPKYAVCAGRGRMFETKQYWYGRKNGISARDSSLLKGGEAEEHRCEIADGDRRLKQRLDPVSRAFSENCASL